MNKKEFFKISVGLKAAYPRFTFLSTDEEMDFWYMMLRDIDYRVAENAVIEYINTSVFPPSIADIRKLCTDRICKPVPSFDEAWGTVQKAISTHGWEHPQEAYAKMDSITAAVVKNLGWTALCRSEHPEADRANFREAYEKKAKQVQAERQIPEFAKQEKQRLIQEYVPAVESKPVRQIVDKGETTDIRDVLDEEQMEERARRFAEIREMVFGNHGE